MHHFPHILASTGAITAVTGIDAYVTAHTNLGNVTTPHGDISGTITATTGALPLIAADYGSISATLTAGGAIGPILANHDITGDITAGTSIGTSTASYNSATITGVNARGGDLSGKLTATAGSVGRINVGGSILQEVWAHTNIGDVTVGLIAHGNLAGKLTAPNGSIGNVTSAGDITQAIHSGGSIGNVLALGNISGLIVSNGDDRSIASVTSWGSITSSNIMADTLGPIEAITLINSSIVAGSGDVFVSCLGKITGQIVGPEKKIILSGGNVIETLDNGHISATSLANSPSVQKRRVDLQNVNWNQIPLKRVDDLVDEKIAMRSDNSKYVMVPTAIGNHMVCFYFEKVREVRPPTTTEFAMIVAAHDPNDTSLPDTSIPTGREVYKLAATVASKYTHSDAASMQQAINDALANKVLVNMLEFNDEEAKKVEDANTEVAILTFAVHVVPTGAAIDNYSQGNTGEAILDIASDGAMFLTFGASKIAGVSKAAVTAMRVTAITLDLGVAGARISQGISAVMKEGGNAEAAGYFGDAFLRLIGASAEVLAELKVARAARAGSQLRKVGGFAYDPGDLSGGLVSGLGTREELALLHAGTIDSLRINKFIRLRGVLRDGIEGDWKRLMAELSIATRQETGLVRQEEEYFLTLGKDGQSVFIGGGDEFIAHTHLSSELGFSHFMDQFGTEYGDIPVFRTFFPNQKTSIIIGINGNWAELVIPTESIPTFRMLYGN